MDRRLQLQELLESILGSDAVYFQPPSGMDMVYPCFVYSLDDVVVQHANNRPYKDTDRYSVQYITRRASDSAPWRAVLALPMATFDRSYPAGGLNHTSINLHF